MAVLSKAHAGLPAALCGLCPSSGQSPHKCRHLCPFCSSFAFFSKQKQAGNNPQDRASVYIFVHVLGGESPCVSYDSPALQPSAGFIIPSSAPSHVAL